MNAVGDYDKKEDLLILQCVADNLSFNWLHNMISSNMLLSQYQCIVISGYLLGPNCCTNIWEYCGSTSCYITHLQQRTSSVFICHIK